MASLPNNNPLPFSNSEVSPEPQRLPIIGNKKTIPYRDSGGKVITGNDILYPTLSGDNVFRKFAPTYNGNLGTAGWYYGGAIFPNGPSDFNVFIGEEYLEDTKSGNIFNYTYAPLLSTAETWAGFAAEPNQPGLFPLTFSQPGNVQITGSWKSGYGGSNPIRVYFTFEHDQYPDTEPSFTIGPATFYQGAGTQTFNITVPAQGTNTFSSFIMKINKNLDGYDEVLDLTEVQIQGEFAAKVIGQWNPFGGTSIVNGDFIMPGGSPKQPRILKLFGAGNSYPSSTGTENTDPINKNLKRWNLSFNTPPITHFTTHDGSLDGISFPKANFWTSYRWHAFPGIDKDATQVEVGCWVRCPKDDFFKQYNFGGFSITFEKDGSGTTNQTQDLKSHVAVFSSTANTLVSAGAFPETVQTQTLASGGGGSYYHNTNLSRRAISGVYQTAFPATKECKYYYFDAEDFGEFTKVSIRIPITEFNYTSDSVATFDMFFAESTSYLSDTGTSPRDSGSIEFYSPYVNNLDANGALVLVS